MHTCRYPWAAPTRNSARPDRLASLSTTVGTPNSRSKISRKRTSLPSTLGPQTSTPSSALTRPAAPIPIAFTRGSSIDSAASTGNRSIASAVAGRDIDMKSAIPPTASTRARAILVPPKSMPRVRSCSLPIIRNHFRRHVYQIRRGTGGGYPQRQVEGPTPPRSEGRPDGGRYSYALAPILQGLGLLLREPARELPLDLG